MSDDITSRLSLPLLDAGQAQKELSHNEALAALDQLVQPVVEAVDVDNPPAAPSAGGTWIVGDAPTGAWAGHSGEIAGWTAGGWRFAVPSDGFAAWSIADGVEVRRVAGAWRIGEAAARLVLVDGEQVVGARQPAISAPTGGATVDSEARGTIAAILVALRAHGLISA